MPNKKENTQEKKFPNGFTAWMETHYEIVQFICTQEEEEFVNNGTVVEYVREFIGIGGLYDLSLEWTDKFEEENKYKEWSEYEVYFDTLEEFLNRENQKKDKFHNLGSPSIFETLGEILKPIDPNSLT